MKRTRRFDGLAGALKKSACVKPMSRYTNFIRRKTEKKKKLVVLLAVVMMFAFSASAYAATFSDVSTPGCGAGRYQESRCIGHY